MTSLCSKCGNKKIHTIYGEVWCEQCDGDKKAISDLIEMVDELNYQLGTVDKRVLSLCRRIRAMPVNARAPSPIRFTKKRVLSVIREELRREGACMVVKQ